MKASVLGYGLLSALGGLALFLPPQAEAQDFSVAPGEIAGQQIMANPADTGTVDSAGLIVTSGNGESAVEMLDSGQNVTIKAGGSVETSGNNASGIFSNGDSALIINSGKISTFGSSSDGVSSFGLNAGIRNDGLITTSGNQVVDLH